MKTTSVTTKNRMPTREMRTGVRNKVDGEGEMKDIPEFTEKEVQAAIDSSQKRNSRRL